MRDAALTNAGGLRFTEIMTGNIVLDGYTKSFQAGGDMRENSSKKAQLFLTVSIFDINNRK